MTKVFISQCHASPMQSGRQKLKGWHISFVSPSGQYIDPLMGWTGSQNTRSQLMLYFQTLEEAMSYAIQQGWTYTTEHVLSLESLSSNTRKPKRYADNFVSSRLR